MEKDFCKKCGKCCSQIAVDFDNEILYRDGVQILTEDFAGYLNIKEYKQNIAICECKYLKDNLCTNPNKPQLCKDFPSFPFAFLPQDCGFEGDMFLKSEHVKQRVRKYKEEILDYEIQIQNGAKDKNQLYKIINNRQAFINKYRQYGSENW